MPAFRTAALAVTACVLAVARPGLAQTAAQEDPLQTTLAEVRGELSKVELQIEQEKRFLTPADGSEADDVRSGLEGRAREAGLTSFELRLGSEGRRLTFADGRPSAVELRPVEMRGREAYENVQRFLGSLARSPRLFILAALRLQAAEDDSVSYSLRLDLALCHAPCRAASAVLADPASFQDETYTSLLAQRQTLEDQARAARLKGRSGRAADQKTALTEQKEIASRMVVLQHVLLLRQAYLERQQFLRLLSDLQARSRSSRGIVAALGAFDQAARDQAVALTQVSYGAGGATVLEGLTLGLQARRGLKPWLAAAGFEPGPEKTSTVGECQAFTVEAGLKALEPGEAGVVGNGLFDSAAPASCTPSAPAPAVRVEARGSAANGITAHLRDVDVADVFGVLHELTGQGFVVDGDVTGRVDADFEDATLEQAVRAMGQTGVVVGPGPLQRVSRSARQATPARTYVGKTVSLSFKAAHLGDLLCFFEDFGQRPVRVPADAGARVSIYARDLPWDQLLDAAARSANLTLVDQGDGLFVGPRAVGNPAGAVDPCKHALGGPRRDWHHPIARPDRLGVGDLHLAGVAREEGGWVAFGYGLSRVLLPFAPDQRLLDGRISTVGPRGVTLETEAGKPVELTLRP